MYPGEPTLLLGKEKNTWRCYCGQVVPKKWLKKNCKDQKYVQCPRCGRSYPNPLANAYLEL